MFWQIFYKFIQKLIKYKFIVSYNKSFSNNKNINHDNFKTSSLSKIKNP